MARGEFLDKEHSEQGPLSRKSRELFGPEKPVVKLYLLVFQNVSNVRKTKRIADLDDLEPRRCEGIKVSKAARFDSKSFGTFEKKKQQAQPHAKSLIQK